MSTRSLEPIAAVIFDWAGTTVDHGSLAPVRTLQRVFAKRDIVLSDEVARRDMGLAKRDHIRHLLGETTISDLWLARHYRLASELDVEELYQEFLPLQMDCLLEYSKVIDGVVDVVATLRSAGIRIGGTTGYTSSMLEVLEAAARKQGYMTDSSLCPEDVGVGRPHPFMCYQLAVDLKAAPLSSCVKIGDTISDIEEGRNAGMWTIGVLRTGNMIGLSESEWMVLPQIEREAALHKAETIMRTHGVHYVIESVAEALPVLEEIANRIAQGDRPC
jgi:phosphonoacetaldehyde hydrolase